MPRSGCGGRAATDRSELLGCFITGWFSTDYQGIRLSTRHPFDSSIRYGEYGSRGSKEKGCGSPIFSRAKSGWRGLTR